jgi:uncharacterized repeat protein (TIGR01451 family)
MPRRAWGLIGCLILAAWMLAAPTIGGAVPDRGLRLDQPTTPGLPPTPTPLPIATDTPLPIATDTPLPIATDTPPVAPTATRKPNPAPEPSPTPTLTPTLTLVPTAAPPPPPPGDPDITKSADPPAGHPGDRIVFSIVVRNGGSIPATNVEVDDTIPSVFRITGATVTQGTIRVSGQRIRATIGTIAPGGEVIVRVTTIIRPGTPPGQVENVAILMTDTPGDDPANNTSTATVTIGEQVPAQLPPTGGTAPWLTLIALAAAVAALAGLALRMRGGARQE